MAFGLSPGELTTIAQNVPYGLPSESICFVQSSVAIESSADGTTWAALTGANTTGIACGGLWIRCTTGAAKVVVKKY